MPDNKLLLSKLSIGGQLYHLKDSELTSTVTNLSTQVGQIETQVNNHETKIYALQQELGGLSGDTVAQIAKIVNELEGTEDPTIQAWTTLVDKLKGIDQATVADHVDEKITAFATETIYYGSEVQNVVIANDDVNSPLYDAQTETLNLTTGQYRLLSAEKGAEYIQDNQNSGE